ncbi:N-alpha-acetyltransferase 20 [Morus notabilis]|uniref:N-alpha-acetyltransferase 20 n=1 Tax=Morus notabilis TaxID=981085 RepID=W9QKT6_9ROSA|nr:N-alpha-acetyltransferase 20 [Morus notabilis]
MTTIRRFCCNDLLRFASVNLDHLTETFNMSFYMTYLARWPDYFHVAEGPGNRIMGYIMGKVEGQGESWHGHVTAVTVAPEYRRQQLAKKLMNLLEDISDKIDKAYFVDLFVRASNTPAIKMYAKLGYVIYRRVLRYYSGEEDGLDMRKALSRDVEKKSIIPLKRPVTPDELEPTIRGGTTVRGPPLGAGPEPSGCRPVGGQRMRCLPNLDYPPDSKPTAVLPIRLFCADT